MRAGLAGVVLSRLPVAEQPVRSTGEGQLAVNALWAAEVLAHDASLRLQVMSELAGPAAAALSLAPNAFKAAWCSGERALQLKLSHHAT